MNKKSKKHNINIILLIVALILSNGVFASITSDLADGKSAVQAAQNAHEADVSADAAVLEFIAADVDVIKAVQTVAKEWSDCDATYKAVRTGVNQSPDKAPQIVSAISSMKNCSCNAQSFWGRSRVEQRLRPSVHRALVRIGNSCSCAAAGIQAAIEIVPKQTEDLIDAAIKSKNTSNNIVDSIGTVGLLPENNSWKPSNASNLSRLATVCKGDNNDSDEFDINEQWLGASEANDRLGQHVLNCDDEDEDENLDQDGSDLIITQYIENSGHDQALEIYNSTDRVVDLALENYQFEVYFHGYDHPGEIVQLNGLVQPKQTYVVANSKANRNILNSSNQKVPGLIFNGADAIVLKNGFKSSDCECSVSTVAAVLNGVSDDNQNEQTQEEQDFLDRLKLHYDQNPVPTSVVDSIGRIWQNKEGLNQDRPIVSDRTLRRKNQVCHGDRLELDAFETRDEWTSYEANSSGNTGQHELSNCNISPTDLILSEYIEGTENNQVLELYNGTNRPINFDQEKYSIAIYRDDDEDPEQIIELSGQVAQNEAFVIAHDDVDDAFAQQADMKTGQLDLSDARAVVLKKVITPAFQGCYADISNWLENSTTAVFILEPIFDPDPGPDSGDDPRDGDDGGDMASPN